MFEFHIEEVADLLQQAADLAHHGKPIPMKAEYLRELADKLTMSCPRPRPTEHDWVYRYPNLEWIWLPRRSGYAIFWFKPRTIDHCVWYSLYDRGWRPNRFPLPMVI